mgnify:CR=1 FL=1|jgi:hypothetical protein
MSENTNRPVAVWRERGDALHTMECSNCGADAHYQIVDGVWRYEPYCAHCGARVYKQEDLPMSEEKKPRLAEVLGVEVGEKFRIADYPVDYGDVAVCTDGKVRRVRSNPPLEHGDKIGANALYHIINHPEYIKRCPRWTEQDVEIAKAIKLLAPAMDCIERISENRSELYSKLDFGAAYLPIPCIPSMKPGERIALNDIIGGRE